jgi:hypothetical protein|tara:strand:+ start:1089 stop:1322 length:234 start_codon:yes stop_codon:yes gene_type:complete
MRAITKVKIVNVPSTEELNAILFDMQEEQINIIKVDLYTIYPDGNMCFVVTYHIQILDAIQEDIDNGKQKHPSNEEI